MSALKDFYEQNCNLTETTERLKVLLYNAYYMLAERYEGENESMLNELGTNEEELEELGVFDKELNQDYYGTELCCECGKEFDFTYNPVKDVHIICSHCGMIQHPCSLCDCSFSGLGCHNAIMKELKNWTE